MKKPRWLKIAEREIGQTEISGEVDNERILEYFEAAKHIANAHDEIAWCSAFVNWAMAESGFKGTKSLLARDWLKWGRKTEKRFGAIVILRRGNDPTKGHVGFYVGDGRDRNSGRKYIKVLGGNQRNMVRVSEYLEDRVLGYRWPITAENLAAAGNVRITKTAEKLVEKLPDVKPIADPLPWYKKHGFKRGLGSLLSLATAILMIIPGTHTIGLALGAVGVPTLAGGFYDAKKKKQKAINQEDSVLRSVLKIIVQLLTKYLERR